MSGQWNVPYGLMFDRKSAVRQRRSLAVTFPAHCPLGEAWRSRESRACKVVAGPVPVSLTGWASNRDIALLAREPIARP